MRQSGALFVGACSQEHRLEGMSQPVAGTNNEPPSRPRRRFAHLPHDSQTERLARAWAVDITLEDALRLLLPELERGAFLSTGQYGDRCVATLTRSGDMPTQWCNAVSGWSKSAMLAIVDLAFRWSVLCNGSWHQAQHVKLVSQLGDDGWKQTPSSEKPLKQRATG
jgi:hypothetical protein